MSELLRGWTMDATWEELPSECDNRVAMQLFETLDDVKAEMRNRTTDQALAWPVRVLKKNWKKPSRFTGWDDGHIEFQLMDDPGIESYRFTVAYRHRRSIYSCSDVDPVKIILKIDFRKEVTVCA